MFTDGTRADYDVIVLCTGYRIDLPFLDPALKQRFVDEEANAIRLYKNVFCPTVGQSLAFIGFLQPTSGGLLTMSEMQVGAQPRQMAPSPRCYSRLSSPVELLAIRHLRPAG